VQTVADKTASITNPVKQAEKQQLLLFFG